MHSDTLDFYWTVSSGSQRKALRALSQADTTESVIVNSELDASRFPEPEHLMVAFTTKMNEPWPGPEWILDSGGYSTLSQTGSYGSTVTEHLDFVAEHDDCISRFALRDWACEPSLLSEYGRAISTHQKWTTRDHILQFEAYETRDIDAEPMAVVQGYDIRGYLEHIDELADYGLITDYVGLGSVCRRGQDAEIKNTILRVREALPERVSLHGFGVKQSVLESPAVRNALDSVDSNAWEQNLYTDATTTAHDGPEWRDEWLTYRKPGFPRCSWENYLITYLDYRNRLTNLLDQPHDSTDRAGSNVSVTSLTDWGANSQDRAAANYQVLECVCGRQIDPGAPSPNPRTGGCRHCRTAALSHWDTIRDRRERAIGAHPATASPSLPAGPKAEQTNASAGQPAASESRTTQTTLPNQ